MATGWRSMAKSAGLWLYRWGIDTTEEQADPPALHKHFAAMKAYYDTERLYQRIQVGISALEPSSADVFSNLENLRSPAFEAVEFHVGHWFPGTLPDALPFDTSSALDKKGRDAVQEVWKASNWNSKKQVFARITGWSGNGFIGVTQRKSDGMPYKRVFESQYVREFKVDERGFVTYFRYAYPVSRGRGRNKKKVYITEIYSKESESIAIYEDNLPIDEPTETKARAKITPFKSLGIDFVPVVWCPFTEATPGMGRAVFEPFRDKIDNVNRAATRLDDMLYRYGRPVWGLESAGLTADNVEMPPPDVVGSWRTSYTNVDEDEAAARGYPQRHADGTLTLGNDPFMKLPMGWTLKSLVPAVDYQAALNIIDAHMEVLKRDMPELRYNDAIESQARDSAKVLDLQLAGAVDRANEARANGEAAIIRAAQMALTVGQKGGKRSPKVKQMFDGLPEFDSGEMDFTFKKRPIIIPTPSDEAEEQIAQGNALNAKITVTRAMGFSVEVLKDEVAKFLDVDVSKLKEDETLVEGQEGESGQIDQTRSIMNQIGGGGAQQAQGATNGGRQRTGGPGGTNQQGRASR